MLTQRTLYLVSADHEATETLVPYLAARDFAPVILRSAEGMFSRIDRLRPAIVVLDHELPTVSGLEAVCRLRQAGDRIPVIVMSSSPDLALRVTSLDKGADDFLVKPVGARELLARIGSVLRRCCVVPGAVSTASERFRLVDGVFDTRSRAILRGGSIRILQSVEYAVLAELSAAAGRPVSRERLMAVSHRADASVLLRSIDATIVRLRRIVEVDATRPRHLLTARGIGYAFVPSDTGGER